MATSEEQLRAGAHFGAAAAAAPAGNDAAARKPLADLTEVGEDEFLIGYVFEGITKEGREKLPVNAPNEILLREWLADAHIEVVSIKKQIGKINRRKKRIKAKEMAAFVGQYADRRGAGQGDIEAINSCAQATGNQVLRQALRDVKKQMQDGVAPEEAFENARIYNFKAKRYTDKPAFPGELIYQIKAGKRGGIVNLLKQFETRLRHRIQKTKEYIGKAIYPSVLFIFGIICLQIMIFVAIPGVKTLYDGGIAGKPMQLPLLTRFVVGISDFGYSPLGIACILSALGGIFGSIYWFYFTKKGRDWRQERELTVPVIGKLLVHYWANIHLTSLGQITKAVDLVTALRETAAGSPHIRYKRAFNAIAATIADHAGSLETNGRPYAHLLGDDFYALVSAGSTGDVSEQILKLADQHDTDFQNKLDQLSEYIDPVSIAFLGVTIGGTVVAMYLPLIYAIGDLAGGGK